MLLHQPKAHRWISGVKLCPLCRFSRGDTDDGYRIHVMQVSAAGFISECGWMSVETIYSKKPYTKWFLQLEIIIIFDLHNNYGHPTSSHPQVHPQIRDESFFYAFSIVYWYSVMISTSKNSRSDQYFSWNSQKTDLHNNSGRSVYCI